MHTEEYALSNPNPVEIQSFKDMMVELLIPKIEFINTNKIIYEKEYMI